MPTTYRENRCFPLSKELSQQMSVLRSPRTTMKTRLSWDSCFQARLSDGNILKFGWQGFGRRTWKSQRLQLSSGCYCIPFQNILLCTLDCKSYDPCFHGDKGHDLCGPLLHAFPENLSLPVSILSGWTVFVMISLYYMKVNSWNQITENSQLIIISQYLLVRYLHTPYS